MACVLQGNRQARQDLKWAGGYKAWGGFILLFDKNLRQGYSKIQKSPKVQWG
jgi:hypothetical protein